MFSVAVFPFGVEFVGGFSKVETDCDLKGIGEPLLWRSIGSTNENLNVTRAFEIMSSLGVRRLREWVWRFLVFNEDGTDLNQDAVGNLSKIVTEAKVHNITVMGMVQDFPNWTTGIENDSQAVPRRNLTAGSPYKEFLEKYEESWETLAREVPDIEVWEIGNEYNLHQFLRPQNGTFTSQERVDIVTDLLYFGSRGIKSGNPNATTVMGGLGPFQDSKYGNGIYDIRDFLNETYKNIESGRWNSTDPDDFFQVACWHPYIFNETPTFQNWVLPNDEVHKIMMNHSDGDKPVVFSELGYSDTCTGLNNTQVAEYLNRTFMLAENLQWLDAIYWFRLVDPDPQYDKNYSCSEYGFGLVETPADDYAQKPVAQVYAIIDEFPMSILTIAMITLTSIAVALGKRWRV